MSEVLSVTEIVLSLFGGLCLVSLQRGFLPLGLALIVLGAVIRAFR